MPDSSSGYKGDVSSTAKTPATAGAHSAPSMESGAGDTLRTGVEAQKNAVAGNVSGVARAVHDAADNIEGTSPQIAKMVRSSADTVGAAADRIQERSVGELLDATTAFAAKRPMTFLAFGMLAGIVLTRMFSSRG